jgi:hypothetical protein
MGTSTTTSTATTTTVRRFVDPDELICSGCGDRAVGLPPAFRQVRDGLPVAQFSHPDRTALCRTIAGQVAEPVEVTRTTSTGRGGPPPDPQRSRPGTNLVKPS